jgi:hypothetical protein
MSSVKFIGAMVFFCLGLWGILTWMDKQYVMEYLLGITAPLAVGVITVLREKTVRKNTSRSLTSFFIKSFFVKMIVYGAYIIMLFNFYTFSHIHFILSFSSCFITLHICEAFFFNSTLLK